MNNEQATDGVGVLVRPSSEFAYPVLRLELVALEDELESGGSHLCTEGVQSVRVVVCSTYALAVGTVSPLETRKS